jgi:hypothetical protein
MSPERQRIAIAEACGWTPDPFGYYVKDPAGIAGPRFRLDELPDYLNDLNAMHEAEMWMFESSETLEGAERLSLYTKHLTALDHPLFATAAQRAKAFLKTFGKWTD